MVRKERTASSKETTTTSTNSICEDCCSVWVVGARARFSLFIIHSLNIIYVVPLFSGKINWFTPFGIVVRSDHSFCTNWNATHNEPMFAVPSVLVIEHVHTTYTHTAAAAVTAANDDCIDGGGGATEAYQQIRRRWSNSAQHFISSRKRGRAMFYCSLSLSLPLSNIFIGAAWALRFFWFFSIVIHFIFFSVQCAAAAAYTAAFGLHRYVYHYISFIVAVVATVSLPHCYLSLLLVKSRCSMDSPKKEIRTKKKSPNEKSQAIPLCV